MIKLSELDRLREDILKSGSTQFEINSTNKPNERRGSQSISRREQDQGSRHG